MRIEERDRLEKFLQENVGLRAVARNAFGMGMLYGVQHGYFSAFEDTPFNEWWEKMLYSYAIIKEQEL
jgi:hypothetical protein